jgi:hypothetical protein
MKGVSRVQTPALHIKCDVPTNYAHGDKFLAYQKWKNPSLIPCNQTAYIDRATKCSDSKYLTLKSPKASTKAIMSYDTPS